MLLLLALPAILYASYLAVAKRQIPQQSAEIMHDEQPIELPHEISTFDTTPAQPTTVITESSHETETVKPILPTVLTSKFDWDRVAACISSIQSGCICYGHNAERLMIPKDTCELAVKHGWTTQRTSRRSSRT